MHFDAHAGRTDPPYRILAVDDEAEILDTYRSSLEVPLATSAAAPLQALERDLYGGTTPSALQGEFALTCCRSGTHALELIAEARRADAPFAAVLLDKSMPDDIDGLIVAREIRRLDPDTIVVLVTGAQDARLPESLGSLAADDRFFIFYKPFYAAEIRQFLSAVCAKAHLERRLFADNAALEAKVRERTAALAAARDAAEASSLSKSAFLANISHEVRTPLNGILGMAALMEHGALDPEQRQKLAVIRDSGEWLLEIINGLLESASIEAGEVRLTRDPMDIAETVREALALVQGVAVGRGVAIASRIEIDPDAIFIGDRQRIKQVLTNLLGNAIKFGHGGEITVTVARDPARRLRFEVSDQGPGVAAEVLPRLFERFNKDARPGALASPAASSGLGLAICKDLVELMGGEIGVETEPGRGSTFWFALPLRQKNRSLSQFFATGA